MGADVIEARDFSNLRGTLVGISDRMLDAHLRLYRQYVDTLNSMEAEYQRLDWTRPSEGQLPPPDGVGDILNRRVGSLDLKADGLLLDIMGGIDRELRAAGIVWRPAFYLGDGDFWTADEGTAVNIPWFLANQALWWLVNERKGRYTPEQVAQCIRHEIGHAVCYAFELWKTPEWLALFGDHGNPYVDTYDADPTDKDHVRYLHRTGEKHYAQKHPDEDFAESFAMWLDPAAGWKDSPHGQQKLQYIERLATSGAIASPAPPNQKPGFMVPYQSLRMTVADFLGQRPSAGWSPHSELLRREPYVYNAVVLHELYFEALGPSTKPPAWLRDAAIFAWGSWESYLLDLRACAGSTNGWALTVWDFRCQRMRNALVSEHHVGVSADCRVLLALDCWEHAYTMDHGISKHAYLAAFFQNVNWELVAARWPVPQPAPVTVLTVVRSDEAIISGDMSEEGQRFAGKRRDDLVLVQVERADGVKQNYWKKPEEAKRIIEEGRGKAVPTEKPPHIKAMADFERRFVNDKIEHGAIVADDGTVLLELTGGRNYIDFTPEQAKKMANAHLTHNHPSGNSLSTDDLALVINTNAKTIRAIGRSKTDGKTRIYSFMRPEAGWPKHAEVARISNFYDREVRKNFESAISNGKMTADEASARHHAEVWSRSTKDIDIGYIEEIVDD